MTLGSHQKCVGESQVHITPKWIIDRLGPFDFDPCAADPRPWPCAAINYTERDDGLSRRWPAGQRGWGNPPFDRYEVAKWIHRFAEHGNFIVLLHARTETDWFEVCWRHASAILFMADRIKFCRPDGSEQPANSGAPAVLVAFGEANVTRLAESGIAGVLVRKWTLQNWAAEKAPSLFADA
jgi:DNA N-6-adenine-methyltransferase (Dam)